MAIGKEGEEGKAGKGRRWKHEMVDEDQMKQELEGVDILKLGKNEVKKLEEDNFEAGPNEDKDANPQQSSTFVSRREEIESMIAR
eukprot:750733-Hanusia_phi.AAC.2